MYLSKFGWNSITFFAQYLNMSASFHSKNEFMNALNDIISE